MHLNSSRIINNTILHTSRKAVFKRHKSWNNETSFHLLEVRNNDTLVKYNIIQQNRIEYSILTQVISRTITFCCFFWWQHSITTAGAVLEGRFFMARLPFPPVKHSFIKSSDGDHTVLRDSRGQTLCHTDKTARSLITMLVWRFVRGSVCHCQQIYRTGRAARETQSKGFLWRCLSVSES